MFLHSFDVGHRSILEPLLERRISTSSRAEELPMKDDGDNRISKLKRKEWSISKSQVIVEKEPETELTSKMVNNNNSNYKIHSRRFWCFLRLQPCLSLGTSLSGGRGSNTKSLGHWSNSSFFIWKTRVTDQTAAWLEDKLEARGTDVSSRCSVPSFLVGVVDCMFCCCWSKQILLVHLKIQLARQMFSCYQSSLHKSNLLQGEDRFDRLRSWRKMLW